MKKVSIFICSFIFSLSLLQYGTPAEGSDNLLKINVSDFIKHTDLNELESNIKKGNILDYLRMRQRLYSFTFDELNELKKHIKKNASMEFLASLIDNISEEKAELYNFKESFLLNNKSLLEGFPFFPDEERIIDGIMIKSERLYFNNLKLALEEMNRAVKKQNRYMFIKADKKFHSLLYVPIKNNILIKILEIFWDLLAKAGDFNKLTDPNLTLSYKRHFNIYKAIESKDCYLVTELLIKHFEITRKRISV